MKIPHWKDKRDFSSIKCVNGEGQIKPRQRFESCRDVHTGPYNGAYRLLLHAYLINYGYRTVMLLLYHSTIVVQLQCFFL